MLELQAFGPLDLRASEGGLGPVLTQPKRLALLLYLVLARPQRLQRRDTLLALFWPEADDAHARKALSQSLFVLRRALPASVLQVRGGDEVGVDPTAIRCDVLEFEQAFREERWADAAELYRGELLAGFHVPGAPGFDSWLDGERERLRELAAGAAWSLARQRIGTGELVLAERAGQRALHLVPTDESPVRDFIRALAMAGDRAAALRFYDKFAAVLAGELEVEPAPETAAVMEAIRAGAIGPAVPAPSTGRAEQPAAPDAAGSASAHGGHDAPTVAEPPAIPSAQAPPVLRRRRFFRPALVGAAAVVALATLVVWLVVPSRQPSTVASRVAVLPFENRTGDRAIEPLGVMAADWITGGLAHVDTLQVVSTPAIIAALAEPGAGADRPRWIARRTGAALVVTGYIATVGDSLELHAELVDPLQGKVLDVFDAARSPRSDLTRALGPIRQQAMGRVALRLDPRMSGLLTVTLPRPPTYDAYQAYMAGMDLFSAGRFVEAVRDLDRAWAADSNFAAPGIWIATVYWNVGQPAREDSILRRLEARRTSLSALERGSLDLLEAELRGDNAAAYRISRDGNRRMPSAEGRMATAHFALHTNRLQEALRIMQAEPEGGTVRSTAPGFHRALTLALHFARDYGQELNVAREARVRYPDRPEPIFWEARALIGLGRVDEALALVDQELNFPAWPPGYKLREAAHELRVHGYPGPAQQLLRRTLAWYRDAIAEGGPFQAGMAQTFQRAGYPDSAARMLSWLAATQPPSLEVQGWLGLALAAAGRVEDARAVDRRLAAWNAPYIRGQNLYWRAVIAAHRGDKDRAVAFLRQAVAQGVYFDVLYENEELQPLWDYPPFRKFMEPPTE